MANVEITIQSLHPSSSILTRKSHFKICLMVYLASHHASSRSTTHNLHLNCLSRLYVLFFHFRTCHHHLSNQQSLKISLSIRCSFSPPFLHSFPILQLFIFHPSTLQCLRKQCHKWLPIPNDLRLSSHRSLHLHITFNP